MLPLHYHRWMTQILGGEIPEEEEATCQDCAMCLEQGGRRTRSSMTYDPSVKCCTYVPVLPNFLVGEILASEDPALARGKESMVQRLQLSAAVTPLFVEQPPQYGLLYPHAGPAFGVSRALICPHYLAEAGEGAGGGTCSIWPYREAICATFYCKHNRGALGQRFWLLLKELLTALERDLAFWCCLELALAPAALRKLAGDQLEPPRHRQLDQHDLSGTLSAAADAERWGGWRERKTDFFVECAARARGLDGERVLAICGPQVHALARAARALHAELLSAEVPERLVFGSFQAVELEAESCRVVTHDANDPLELPRQLVDLLHHFDGRPTAAVLQAIEREAGVQLDAELVLRLVDFEILVRVEGEGDPA